MMRTLFIFTVLVLSAALYSCDESKASGTSTDDTHVGEVIGGPAGAVISAMEEEGTTLDGPKVLIETEFGNMTVVLYDKTPKHRDNFLKLVKEGFYDDLLFHRIIKGFMIQGGDPESKGAPAGKMLGNGGPGYTIDAEFVPELFHKKGALAAARQGDQVNPAKASSGSQFYIVQGRVMTEEQLTIDMRMLNQYLGQLFQKPEYANLRTELNELYSNQKMDELNKKMVSLKPVIEKEFGVNLTIDVPEDRLKAYTTIGGTPSLDDQYTVFGEVIEGLEVVDKIAAVQTAPGDRPVADVVMKMSIIEE